MAEPSLSKNWTVQEKLYIKHLDVKDVRFPTSLQADGSDAMHTDPDYSCAYVVISTSVETAPKGHGFTFTIGKGTEIVATAIESLAPLIIGREFEDIVRNFASVWRELTSHSQLRWIGPEKGVIHLAVGAVVNALWDLWAKLENKPLWKLLVDLDPETLVSTIDFRYISDALTREEAVALLRKMQKRKQERETYMRENGYPAYNTAIGWLGYDDEKIKKLCHESLQKGFTRFKVKVGANLVDDQRRLAIIRDAIGYDKYLMVDANQKWDVLEAISWMEKLVPFRPLWIEEPTSPDDVLGHARIAEALRPHGVKVATGEQCHNRVMFKQFLQAKAIDFCQVDCCRLGGVNEVMAVVLMAAKFKVPVCPHAGGVGLCELVQHIAIWDYISVSGTLEDRVAEYVDHLHEHFVNPVVIKNSCYMPPKTPGYSTEMKQTSLSEHEYPIGRVWKELFEAGIYPR